MIMRMAFARITAVTATIDEQPPADGRSRPRRVMRAGSFTLLVMSQK